MNNQVVIEEQKITLDKNHDKNLKRKQWELKKEVFYYLFYNK